MPATRKGGILDNRKRVLRIAVTALALALLATSVITTPAVAGSDGQDRGKLARVIIEVSSSGGGKPASAGGEVSAMSSGCITTYHNITGANQWGEWLWRLEQNTYWCWDGSIVTYAARNTPVYTYGVGWRTGGIMSSSESGVGTWEYRAYVQALFYRCAPSPWGEVCTDHVYPWIQSILRGDGTNGGSAGT
jgi:hypothetical protein